MRTAHPLLQLKDLRRYAKQRGWQVMAALLAVFAEFEREILRERVKGGIEQA